MPIMRITDSTGDTRMPYEHGAESEEAVRAVFDQYISTKKYAAFADGKRRITAFDPDASDITLVAPIVAG